MVVHSNKGKVRTENILVQVTTILLTKGNYLNWSITITIGIVGWGKYNYIASLMPSLAWTDPSWATWFLKDNQVKM